MGVLFNQWGFHGANCKLELRVEKRRETLSSRATLKRQGFRMVTVGAKTKLENFSATKVFLATTTERIDLNIFITGAGA